MNAAGQYIGNAIQEMMVVKKEAAVPRILPSISHMKVVSKISGLAYILINIWYLNLNEIGFNLDPMLNL